MGFLIGCVNVEDLITKYHAERKDHKGVWVIFNATIGNFRIQIKSLDTWVQRLNIFDGAEKVVSTGNPHDQRVKELDRFLRTTLATCDHPEVRKTDE